MNPLNPSVARKPLLGKVTGKTGKGTAPTKRLVPNLVERESVGRRTWYPFATRKMTVQIDILLQKRAFLFLEFKAGVGN